MPHWLLKSEPTVFSWTDLCAIKRDMWDGVRNYQARNNLKAMQVNDLALFYHSGKEKAIQGIVKVVRTHYPDPTATDPHSWVVVDVVPVRALKQALPLARLRREALLSDMALLCNPRLSVQPVTQAAFTHILTLDGAPSS